MNTLNKADVFIVFSCWSESPILKAYVILEGPWHCVARWKALVELTPVEIFHLMFLVLVDLATPGVDVVDVEFGYSSDTTFSVLLQFVNRSAEKRAWSFGAEELCCHVETCCCQPKSITGVEMQGWYRSSCQLVLREQRIALPLWTSGVGFWNHLMALVWCCLIQHAPNTVGPDDCWVQVEIPQKKRSG